MRGAGGTPGSVSAPSDSIFPNIDADALAVDHDHGRVDSLEARQDIAAEFRAFEADLEARDSADALALPRRADRDAIAAIRAARALASSGDVPGAIDSLLALYRNERGALRVRAQAALAISEIAFENDSTRARAELFFIRARQLWPGIDARAVELKLLMAQGRSAAALEVVRSLRESTPASLELRAIEVRLLRATADRPGMLAAADALVVAARAADVPIPEQIGYLLLLASAEFENRHAARAVDLYRQVLRVARDVNQLQSAHYGIAEIVSTPEFADAPRETEGDRRGPHAVDIQRLFDQANLAYAEGRFNEVRQIAERILRLDPNDGLAHNMWGIAVSAQAVARRPLVAALDTEPERLALIRALEARCAEARVDDGSGRRAGTVDDLFPEWDTLNEVQRAHVALSVLGYGAMIPRVMEAGAVYHIAGVGTSGAFFDPNSAPADTNAFGRHYYVIRGWYDGDTDFIVTGVERLDQGARNGSSTVTHEFGHLVHRVLTRAREVPESARTPDQVRDAALATQITRLYAAANAGHARFLDAYSSNNEREYFAQAMEAYMNPYGDASRRLFSAQPELWRLCHDLMERLQTFPPEARLSAHPPIGLEAVASPLNLQALIDNPATAADVRRMAVATMAHLEAALSMAPLPVTHAPEVPAPTGLRHARSANLVRLVSAGDYVNAEAVARDIQADIAAGVLTGDELTDALQAVTFSLDRAARAAEWGFWDYLACVLAYIFGLLYIGVIFTFMHKRDERNLRNRLQDIARVPQPPPSSRASHPDLAGLDPPAVAERRRLLLSRAGELLAYANGAREGAPAPAEQVAIMGFDELSAQIDLDVARVGATPALVALKRRITAAERAIAAGDLVGEAAVTELEAVRAAYLETQ
ncbi:MAG: zinc-dependent peptidase [Deltaproteobacteria bacterium]|nr:zinc-dependent peptidase [Deltaproteobacteria bacterium]